MPVLGNLFTDSIPRVQAHAANGLTNFVEGTQKDTLKNYSEELLKKSLELVSSGISIVKEGAVSLITAVA